LRRGGIKQEKGLVGLQIKDVIKQWKPELKESGFVYKDNAFRYGPTAEEALKFDISAQKNVREDTFKVNLAIVIKNPFADQPDLPVLMGNLRATGVSLHVPRDCWWPPEAAAQALQATIQEKFKWKADVARYLDTVAIA